MSEHPIIFSGPMVKAILDGRKTQTRRVVQAFPTSVSWAEWNTKDATLRRPCPYGGPGDALWVREAWMAGYLQHGAPPIVAADWLADCKERIGCRAAPDAPDFVKAGPGDVCLLWRRKPSIHMPRWASRLTLRMLGVRVERLQAITSEDVAREGIPGMVAGRYQCERCNGSGSNVTHPSGCPACGGTGDDPRAHFAIGWDTLNGRRAPWASNPWVFVVSFERVEVAP